MNIKNIKGSVALKVICLVLIIALAISTFAIFVPSFASAKTNKDLWRNNSSVTFDGSSITTVDNDNVTVSYKPSVYMNGFNFKFQLTSNDFEKFIVTFTSKASMESNLVGKVTSSINLVKDANGKISASINDKESVTIDTNFYNTELNLTFDKATKEFKLNGTAIGKVESDFYLDIADTMAIKMQQIAEEKTASVKVMEICGVNVSGSFEDTEAPIVMVDEALVPNNVCMGDTVEMPFVVADKLDGDITYDLNVKYSATSDMADATDIAKEEIIETTTGIKDAFIASKEGFYKVTLKVKDSNGNETVKEFDTISAVESTMSNISISSDFVPAYDEFQELGEYFKMPIPDVTYEIADGVYSNQAKIAIQYRSPNSSEWSPSIASIKNEKDKNTLLAVKGNEVGAYKVRYVVLDSRGNNEVYSRAYDVYFNDTVAPVVKVEGFVEEAIINKSYSVAVMSATDKSSVTKTTKVFKKGVDGAEDTEIKLEGNAFVPTELGDYYVVYTAVDKYNNGAGVEIVKNFKVVEDTTSGVANSLSALEIVLICVAGVSVIGIVLLFVIKPRK